MTACVLCLQLSVWCFIPSVSDLQPEHRLCPLFTHRHQGAVPALLRRRPSALRELRAASSSSSSAASRRPLAGLVSAGLGLPVLVGPLGLGLQAALVQGEGLLSVQLQPLQRRVLVAALAAVVMLPEELDPPAEPLHHRAVSRCNKIRHHQYRLVVNSGSGFVHKKLKLALFTVGVYTPPLALYKDSCAGSMEATFVLLMASVTAALTAGEENEGFWVQHHSASWLISVKANENYGAHRCSSSLKCLWPGAAGALQRTLPPNLTRTFPWSSRATSTTLNPPHLDVQKGSGVAASPPSYVPSG